MNTKLGILTFVALFGAFRLFGQGSFVYDQQSALENSGAEGLIDMQPNAPVGQSFTPSLNSVGFVRFFMFDGAHTGQSATVIVNLRSDSISGPILGTSE